MLAAIVLAAATLVFPAARQMAALEADSGAAEGSGLVIDPTQDLPTKARDELEFTPYHWAGAIPFTTAHQLMLDSPWLEQAILPLTYRDGSPLLNAQLSQQEARGINLHDGTVQWLSAQSLQSLLRNTTVIYYRTPLQGFGLADQIGIDNASQFVCTSHVWYLKCVRGSSGR